MSNGGTNSTSQAPNHLSFAKMPLLGPCRYSDYCAVMCIGLLSRGLGA